MKTVFKSQFYKVVRLTQAEKQGLGIGDDFVVLDIFFGDENNLANICTHCTTKFEAIDWIFGHE